MSFISFWALIDVLVLLAGIGLLVRAYFRRCFTYWQARGVPTEEPRIPFGNYRRARAETLRGMLQRYYDTFQAQGYKHCGFYFFTTPFYVPICPQLIKALLVSDFSHFTDHGSFFNEKADPLSAHLFALEGSRWRSLRVKLTPTFTSGRMKQMFPTFLAVGEQLREAMGEMCARNEPVDIKEVLVCFTTDVIGSCAIGVECNSFKDKEAEFRMCGKQLFNKSTKWEALRRTLAFASPKLAQYLGLRSVPPGVSTFLRKVVAETVEFRAKNNVVRNDFMQLLIELREKDVGFTMDDIAAQIFIFFAAGFETSSTTMTFALYELAVDERLQDRVRAEINAMVEGEGGGVTYESVMGMKLMGQVIDETLRKYPPAQMLMRKCTKAYHVPDTDLHLNVDDRVLIPIMALHRNPHYFPDPDRFDPDRFSDVNRSNITPYTYLPFGEGPRICIGSRFGLLQTRVGLYYLLRNFRFRVHARTIQPLRIDPAKVIHSPLGGVWLNVEKIE